MGAGKLVLVLPPLLYTLTILNTYVKVQVGRTSQCSVTCSVIPVLHAALHYSKQPCHSSWQPALGSTECLALCYALGPYSISPWDFDPDQAEWLYTQLARVLQWWCS